jgi:hypothetical protein
MSEPRHNSQASVALDDSGAGLVMFVIFTSAVLIVTGAVVLVALVGGWWIVGVAFAIHVLMTAVVVATIVSVMNGRASATELARAPACQPGPLALQPADDRVLLRPRRARGGTPRRLEHRPVGTEVSTIVPTVSRNEVDVGRP